MPSDCSETFWRQLSRRPLPGACWRSLWSRNRLAVSCGHRNLLADGGGQEMRRGEGVDSTWAAMFEAVVSKQWIE